MLYVCRNMNDCSRKNLNGRFPLFLILTAASYPDKHLTTATLSPMYMPVVAASGFKSHIRYVYLLTRNGGQIAVADKILGVGRIWFANGENHLALESGLGICRSRIIRPHILGQTESRSCLGPSCIKANVSKNLGNFNACDSIVFCRLEMIGQR